MRVPTLAELGLEISHEKFSADVISVFCPHLPSGMKGPKGRLWYNEDAASIGEMGISTFNIRRAGWTTALSLHFTGGD